ncbi:hypothetical protein PCANC_18859 [Puccinia coronata f. sp. avenae]|uniref:Uncharacterized protein n=1 Tax=Puccinia coronata f. sp. avenae TaxID=200324 RepID=A0A2N5U8G9_9BASI|nr:hypothetical protein PCANC_18859 [Puccinia coronata f. sp. avenae]
MLLFPDTTVKLRNSTGLQSRQYDQPLPQLPTTNTQQQQQQEQQQQQQHKHNQQQEQEPHYSTPSLSEHLGGAVGVTAYPTTTQAHHEGYGSAQTKLPPAQPLAMDSRSYSGILEIRMPSSEHPPVTANSDTLQQQQQQHQPSNPLILSDRISPPQTNIKRSRPPPRGSTRTTLET